MATNRDFDIIKRSCYDGNYSNAINQLVDIVQQQQGQIEVLQDKLERLSLIESNSTELHGKYISR